MSDEIRAAHRRSSRHRDELGASTSCGCFYCLSVFPPDQIKEWVDEEQTALCPNCRIDAVIGNASGYPVEREFLRRMKRYWFE